MADASKGVIAANASMPKGVRSHDPLHSGVLDTNT